MFNISESSVPNGETVAFQFGDDLNGNVQYFYLNLSHLVILRSKEFFEAKNIKAIKLAVQLPSDIDQITIQFGLVI